MPQPLWPVELQRPPAHDSPATCAFEHPRLHSPQSAVLVPVFVSHPFDGSDVQWPKPESQLSEQSGLHVPSIALQHVVPAHTTEPVFSVYVHAAPGVVHVPSVG